MTQLLSLWDNKKQFKQESLYFKAEFKGRVHHVGMGQWQKRLSSQETEREEGRGSAYSLPFVFSLVPQPTEWGCPHSGCLFPPQLCQSRNPSQTCSMEILSLIKLVSSIITAQGAIYRCSEIQAQCLPRLCITMSISNPQTQLEIIVLAICRTQA